jgi:hypothetical protein
MNSLLNTLKCKEIGSVVCFKNEKKTYKVIVKNERYIIATKKVFNNVHYTIIDLEECVCSGDSYIFSIHDYASENDCQNALNELIEGKMRLSRRNSAEIEEVLKNE